jgi:hypothetical protein
MLLKLHKLSGVDFIIVGHPALRVVCNYAQSWAKYLKRVKRWAQSIN